MADLAPEALADDLEAEAVQLHAEHADAMAQNAHYHANSLRGQETAVRRIAARVRKLAPAHAALAAERDDYRQRLTDALAGRPAVIDWTGPDEIAQATRDISQRVTSAFKEGIRLGVRVAGGNPGVTPHHAASVTPQPVTVSQEAEAIAARLKILAAGLAAERDTLAADIAVVRDHARALQAELESVGRGGIAIIAERDRYRAALEAIRDGDNGNVADSRSLAIAREALEGGDYPDRGAAENAP